MSSELSREQIDGFRIVLANWTSRDSGTVQARWQTLCDMAEAWRAHREVGDIQVRRWQQCFDDAIKTLAHIHALMSPPDTVIDGKRFVFNPPPELVHEAWRGLSDAIRNIPDEIARLRLAAPTGAPAHLAPESDPKAHRRCKCEFSSGGVLAKQCEFHSRISAPASDTVQVPREPTQVMCQAGQEKAREWPKFPLRISPIYRAMLAAAPSAQKGESQGGSGDASGSRK